MLVHFAFCIEGVIPDCDLINMVVAHLINVNDCEAVGPLSSCHSWHVAKCAIIDVVQPSNIVRCLIA